MTSRPSGAGDRQTWKRSVPRAEEIEYRAQTSWLTVQRMLLSGAAAAMVAVSVWLLLGVKRQVPLVAVFVRDYPTAVLPIAAAAEDAAVLANLSREEQSLFDPGVADVIDISDRCRSATAEAFVAELVGAVSRVRPGGPGGDAVVLYVAAHGGVDTDGRACLLPPRFAVGDTPATDDWVGVERLLEALGAAVGPETKLLVILDACRATAGEGLGLIDGGFPAAVDAAISARPPPNTWVLLSASAGEIARAEPAAAGSPFARAFASGLEGLADAPPWGNGDGQVGLSELAAFVREEVRGECRIHLGVPQTPCLFPVVDSETTDPAVSWVVRSSGTAATPALTSSPQNTEMAEWLAERWQNAALVADHSVHVRPLLWSRYRRLLLRCEALARAGAGWDTTRTDLMAEIGRIEAVLNQPLIGRVGGLPLLRLWTLAAPAEQQADHRDAGSLDAAAIAETDIGIDRWLAGLRDESTAGPPPATDSVPLDPRRWLLRATAAWEALDQAAAAGIPIGPKAAHDWLKLVGPCPLADRVEPMELHLVRLLVDALPTKAWSGSADAFGATVRVQGLFGRSFLADDVRADRLLHAAASHSTFSRHRLAALDQFLVGDGRAVEVGGLAARDAEDAGRLLAAAGAELSEAWRLLDEVRADLPWLAIWFQRMAMTVLPGDSDIDWDGIVTAVSELEAAVAGELPESAERQRALIADVWPRLEAVYRPLRVRYDDAVDTLLQRSAADAATLAAVETALAVPLAVGDRRNRLAELRRTLEQQLRNVPVIRRRQVSKQEHDPGDALAGWTDWRGGRGLPLAICLAAPVSVGREAAGAAAVSEQIGTVGEGLRTSLVGLNRQLEAVDAAGSTAPAALRDAELLVRRVGPVAVDDRFADDERSPVTRGLRVAWRDRFLRLADRILDDFLGPATASGPVWCLPAAEECLRIAGELLPNDDPASAPAIARRLARLQSDGEPFVDVRNQPDRFDLPADETVVPPLIDTRLVTAEGVPRGIATMWIEDSSSASDLPLRTIPADEVVGRLPILGSQAGSTRWRFDRQAVPRITSRLGSVIDVSVFFRGHRHFHEVPIAAAGATLPIVWRRPDPVPPRVTVRGDVRQQETVALIFDCSGSMSRNLPNGQSRFEVGQEVLSGVLSQLAVAGNWNASLWLYGHRTRWIRQGNGWVAGLTAAGERERTAFEQAGRLFSLQPGDDVGQMLPLQPLGQGQVEAVRAALAKLAPGGETPLYRAIREVIQQDIQAINPQTPARIVVITDGVNDQTEVPPTTAAEVERLLEQINERRTEPVKLDIIGFALQAETAAERAKLRELQDLVRRVDGRFIDAGDRDRLLAGLRDVLRLVEWEARDREGNLRRADLGEPIEFPIPERGGSDRYRVAVPAALGGAESGVELRGGELLELHLAGRGSRLEHRRYDGGSEQRIRDSQTDLPDPTDDRRRWFVAAHLPRRKNDDERMVFPISLQQADAALFSPRPAEVWIEIQPLGVTADRFLVQDAIFENNRPVPVLDAIVPGWPTVADEAEILIWFTSQPTPPIALVPVADLPAGRSQSVDLPGNLPADLTVQRDAEGDQAWKLTVRESPHAPQRPEETALLVSVRPEPAKIGRTLQPEGGWIHEFLLDDRDSDWTLVIVDRESMQRQAVGPKQEDGRRVPLRVRMPTE